MHTWEKGSFSFQMLSGHSVTIDVFELIFWVPPVGVIVKLYKLLRCTVCQLSRGHERKSHCVDRLLLLFSRLGICLLVKSGSLVKFYFNLQIPALCDPVNGDPTC